MTNAPLGSAALVGFAATTDLDRSGPFYRDVLGLTVVFETPQFVVFDSAGTTLRLNLVDHFEPVPFTVLGWRVADITATVVALRAAQVDFLDVDGLEQDEHGLWTTPSGNRVAWFHDPDGNVLSLEEPPG